jgi:hypothetical protein
MAVLKRNLSWKDKPRYSDDDTLHTFTWPYGTGELIDELRRVREILDIADKIQPSEAIRPIEIDVEFEECFINSHENLMMLMDRLTDAWNLRALFDIINTLDKSVDGVSQAYKTANLLFQTTSDKLLRMRHLYEQLKPETHSLITKCSGPIQLERSMIAQKKEPAQTSSANYVFQPACGFRFNSPSDTQKIEKQEASQGCKTMGDIQVACEDRITAIDMELKRLHQERDTLVKKMQASEMRKVNLDMYERLNNMVAKGKDIHDPVVALHYANDAIAPQKHIINRNSASFQNMLQVLPQSYPSKWTQDDASKFFQSVSDALDEDLKTILATDSAADVHE